MHRWMYMAVASGDLLLGVSHGGSRRERVPTAEPILSN